MKCSNGNDGQYIESLCATCPLGEKPCPVIYAHFEYGYAACGNEDIAKVLNVFISDKDGKCRIKELLK